MEGLWQLRYGDALLILGISFASAWICEGISWLLIYRTASYKALRSTIDRTSKKLENMKGTGTNPTTTALSASKKSKAKKMDRFETSLKESSRDLSFAKFKSGAVVAIVLVVVFGLLSSLFEGKAVAKLPFAPLPFIQRMSHRGLPGDDATDCAMVFLYFLCSVSIRSNLQKFLGFAPPRGMSNNGLFPMPDPKAK
ncbi:hypothetical protein O6H91_10G020300 [Diphasiastrum complanatum]|uniref:Uncharacterized protein n=2 Tax=Diphasiastrum complanatum TaxID=34168 RepID=A0ACC2CEQ7_DIPCM|nr:hypothetical protein O6H91_10G019300 [Diphasiastrum complanatum]KAJ7540536.1 hypothetical protein O6H91_10G020300 [Diphasiastrum complanatum]